MACYIFAILAAICFGFGYANATAVSDAQKQEIVDSHNEWRKNAGAIAMRRLKWNDQLAQFAEKAAAKCAFDHTTWEQRQNIAGFSYIGENIYVNTAKTTFKEAVDSWGSEEKDYDLNSNTCSAVCGHYTQITWAKTSDVGCAIAQCGNVAGFNNPGYLIFCNYGIGGNMQGEKPFQKGAAGSKCQAEFKVDAGSDGLCGEGGSPSADGQNNDAPGGTGPDEGSTGDNGDNENTGDNGDNGSTGDNSDNGNTGDNGGNDGNNQGGDEGGSSGDCKDEIWYCHDWLQACGEEWASRACRKSCKFC